MRIRRAGAWLAALILLCGTTCPAGAESWLSFTPPDGTFSLLLPSPPRSEPPPAKGARSTLYTVRGPRCLYVIARTPYPAEALADCSVDQVLEAELDLLARGLEARIEGRRPFALQGRPALEARLDLPARKVSGGGGGYAPTHGEGDVVAVVRCYLDGKELVTVLTLAPALLLESEEVRKAHRSFRFGKPSP